MTCRELEQFLYPYLDGEFASDERLDLERHLAECQDCALKVHQEGRFREALRVKAREALQSTPQQAPASLRQGVMNGLRREQRRALTAHWLRLSAAALVVVVAGGVYWRMRPDPRQRFLDDATRWYQKRLPHEIRPGTPEDAEAWFWDKLDHRVVAPRFDNARVEGARLLQVQDRPAAYITYETVKDSGAPANRVGVFVFDDRDHVLDGESLPSVESNRGYQVAMWRDGEIVYELVSDLDEAAIRQMLEQLRRHPGPSRPAAVPVAPVPAPRMAVPAPARPSDIQPASYNFSH